MAVEWPAKRAAGGKCPQCPPQAEKNGLFLSLMLRELGQKCRHIHPRPASTPAVCLPVDTYDEPAAAAAPAVSGPDDPVDAVEEE